MRSQEGCLSLGFCSYAPICCSPRHPEDALGLVQRDAGFLSQIVTGDDGIHDLFGYSIADGDTDEMPLVVADGQGR